MDPNSQPQGPTPYDFFLNQTPQPKKSLLPQGNGSFTRRVLIVVGGGVGLLIVLWIAATLLLGGSASSSQELISIAQQQTEIIRVVDLGAQKAQSSDTKAFAETTKLSLLSAQKDLLDVLKKQGKKPSVKLLAQTKNAQTDALLDAANQNGRFDDTFTQELKNELTTYQAAVQKAFKGTSKKATKDLLTNEFNQTNLLLGK